MTKPITLYDYKRARQMRADLLRLKLLFDSFYGNIKAYGSYKSVQAVYNEIGNEIVKIEKDLDYLNERLGE